MPERVPLSRLGRVGASQLGAELWEQETLLSMLGENGMFIKSTLGTSRMRVWSAAVLLSLSNRWLSWGGGQGSSDSPLSFWHHPRWCCSGDNPLPGCKFVESAGVSTNQGGGPASWFHQDSQRRQAGRRQLGRICMCMWVRMRECVWGVCGKQRRREKTWVLRGRVKAGC